jgi:antitoxin MazE
MTLKIARIGNSRGIRLPAAMLRRYHITDAVLIEEKADGIVLRPRRNRQQKLSWAETATAMAKAEEDWSAWEDATSGDGLHGL